MAVTYSPTGAPLTRPAFPALATLTHMAAGFLALTLVADIAYLRTMQIMWQDFASWLLFFGMVVAGLAVLVWVIAAVTRRTRPVWGAVLVKIAVLIVAFINNLVHAGDGWTAVMPWGVGLSALTCVLMLVAAALGRRALIRV